MELSPNIGLHSLAETLQSQYNRGHISSETFLKQIHSLFISNYRISSYDVLFSILRSLEIQSTDLKSVRVLIRERRRTTIKQINEEEDYNKRRRLNFLNGFYKKLLTDLDDLYYIRFNTND